MKNAGYENLCHGHREHVVRSLGEAGNEPKGEKNKNEMKNKAKSIEHTDARVLCDPSLAWHLVSPSATRGQLTRELSHCTGKVEKSQWYKEKLESEMDRNMNKGTDK